MLDQDRVVERLSQDSIVTALSSLPDDFRDVVVLVDIGDFSYADAAQILDIPIGTVMSRLHRGRRLLKAKLAEEAVRVSWTTATSASSSSRATSTASSPTTRSRRRSCTSTAATTAGAATASRRSLRTYVRTTAAERMPPGLMEKLAQLRTTDPGTLHAL